jgi:hypothetical protein
MNTVKLASARDRLRASFKAEKELEDAFALLVREQRIKWERETGFQEKRASIVEARRAAAADLSAQTGRPLNLALIQ